KLVGEGVVREGRIACGADEGVASEHLVEFERLRIAALIEPNQGGTDYLVSGIEKNRAMHLAGETDAGNVSGVELGRLQGSADGLATGMPPIARILFGPSRFRTGEVLMLGGGGSDNVSGGINDQGARATGTYVNTKIAHR